MTELLVTNGLQLCKMKRTDDMYRLKAQNSCSSVSSSFNFCHMTERTDPKYSVKRDLLSLLKSVLTLLNLLGSVCGVIKQLRNIHINGVIISLTCDLWLFLSCIYRVIGSLSNFERFSKAFGCSSGDRMDRYPKCSVWWSRFDASCDQTFAVNLRKTSNG